MYSQLHMFLSPTAVAIVLMTLRLLVADERARAYGRERKAATRASAFCRTHCASRQCRGEPARLPEARQQSTAYAALRSLPAAVLVCHSLQYVHAHQQISR